MLDQHLVRMNQAVSNDSGCEGMDDSPDHMSTTLITLAQNVEQKEVDVIVQGFVVQEQLGQVAQVLAVGPLLLAVHLKHRHVPVAVEFVAGRVLQARLAQVLQHLPPLLEEAQVELREIQHLNASSKHMNQVCPYPTGFLRQTLADALHLSQQDPSLPTHLLASV